MNIAILTLPLSTNYGGILQNYALQQVLKKMGHNPYTFDLGKFDWFDCIKYNVKSMIKTVIGRPAHFIWSPKKYLYKETSLRRFVENHIILLSPRVRRPNSSILKKYNINAIIVGSDQVWRRNYYTHFEDMFLQFVQDKNIRKIAYAASFGVSNWIYSIRQTKKCRSLAKKFDAISVREDSAVGLCTDYIGVNAKHVLDPTLLLTSDEYLDLIKDVPIKKEKVLFAYLLDFSEKKIEFVKSVANKKRLVPLIVSAGHKLQPDDSIELWLSRFRDSSYIITDSFHGTVFSIIFKKEFTTLTNQKRGNDRMDSLLTCLNLKKRLVDIEKSNDALTESINWEIVNVSLNELRLQSIKFITKSILK